MKYCVKCGNQLLDYAEICPKCGCWQNENNIIVSQENFNSNKSESKFRDSIVVAIIIPIVLSLAIIFLLFITNFTFNLKFLTSIIAICLVGVPLGLVFNNSRKTYYITLFIILFIIEIIFICV